VRIVVGTWEPIPVMQNDDIVKAPPCPCYVQDSTGHC
jgi:hypothetical protein